MTNLWPMMARFNAWANRQIYDACAGLDDADYRADRGAFFGSIHNTLNHLLVVDRLWLARFEHRASAITALDQILHDDFQALSRARVAEDGHLIDYVDALDPAALDRPLAYRRMSGSPGETPLAVLLHTLFNHQTHHRGQVHAMLSQAGVAPPELDIINFYPG